MHAGGSFMTLVGTTIGQYRIESEIGQGGMGVVYRAVDTQLGRRVAIKTLRPEVILDQDRRQRFVQEARSVSALNHPGIVTLYHVGAEGTIDFIVMELVAGRSLQQAISGRALPVDEAVRYAIQIAQALSAAHQIGIVHRDLKPSNVMLTEKGQIKLLDFGLAKLVELDEPGSDVTTMMGPATRPGMVVGTAAYMSPEQAQGARLDCRSDIFSFGIILHEMLTGRLPSPGDPESLASVPRDLRRIVRRCLQLDPAERFQAIDDVRISLQDAELGAALPPEGSRRPGGRLALAVVVLVAAAAIATGLWWLARERVAPRLVLTRLTQDSTFITDQVISSDGRLVAYASDRGKDGGLDIWVQQVAGGVSVRITSDPADDVEPSFSPDGSQLAFRSDRDGGGVYVVSTLGGDARRVADRGRRPKWSPDGKRIAYWVGPDTAFVMSRADASHTYVVDAASGQSRPVAEDFGVAMAPIWAADSSRLLVLGSRTGITDIDWWVVPLDGGAPTGVGASAVIRRLGLLPSPDTFFVPEAWSADGRVFFSAQSGDSTNIWNVAVAPSGKIRSAPVRMTAGAGLEIRPSVDAAERLVFSVLTRNVDLWSLPIATATGRANGDMQPLTRDAAVDAYPWLSPDGSKLLFMSNRGGGYDLWVRDMPTGRDAVLAAQVAFPTMPVLAKDASRAFFESRDHSWFSVAMVGAGTVPSSASSSLCDDCHLIWELSADGRWAVEAKMGDAAIVTRELESGKTFEFLRAPGDVIGRLRISPDDRWVAFHHRSQGVIRVVVAPFRPGSFVGRDEWIPATPADAAGSSPAWSPDGGLLYYFSDQDGHVCLWAQPIDPPSGRPRGGAVAVWHFHDARRSLGRLSLPLRSMTMTRDRIVLSLVEDTGTVWMAAPPQTSTIDVR
jgi:eukaryotic-like serine/threonine-protein kinase